MMMKKRRIKKFLLISRATKIHKGVIFAFEIGIHENGAKRKKEINKIRKRGEL